MEHGMITRELSDCETLIMKIIWDAKEDIAVQEYSEEQLQIVLKHELAINTDNLYSNIVNK